MDQAQALLPGQFGQDSAPHHGGGDAALEEGMVDIFLGIEAPDPGADLRGRAPGRARQRPALGGDDIDRVARPRPAFELRYRAGKYPGMSAQQGFFLAGMQGKDGHGVDLER